MENFNEYIQIEFFAKPEDDDNSKNYINIKNE